MSLAQNGGKFAVFNKPGSVGVHLLDEAIDVQRELKSVDGGAQLFCADLAALVGLRPHAREAEDVEDDSRETNHDTVRWNTNGAPRPGSCLALACRARQGRAGQGRAPTLPPMATKASTVSVSLVTGCISLNLAMTLQNCMHEAGNTLVGAAQYARGLRVPAAACLQPSVHSRINHSLPQAFAGAGSTGTPE